MRHCIICKSEHLDEENVVDGIIFFTCSECGFIHQFKEDNYNYQTVMEAQEKEIQEKENAEALSEAFNDLADRVDFLESFERRK